MANKIKLVVGGIDYLINTDEDEAYVHALGSELSRYMDSLAKDNPFLSTTMVAVLAALDFLDESKKAKEDSESLRMQMKEYIEEAACARLEADEARREVERLNRELRSVRARLSQAEQK